jgi:hypothetical protein
MVLPELQEQQETRVPRELQELLAPQDRMARLELREQQETRVPLAPRA